MSLTTTLMSDQLYSACLFLWLGGDMLIGQAHQFNILSSDDVLLLLPLVHRLGIVRGWTSRLQGILQIWVIVVLPDFITTLEQALFEWVLLAIVDLHAPSIVQVVLYCHCLCRLFDTLALG